MREALAMRLDLKESRVAVSVFCYNIIATFLIPKTLKILTNFKRLNNILK